jgi:hypothetical protein
MPGELVEVSDYSFSSKKRQITMQNTYFNTYFGRSDFEEIDEHLTARALQYMLKYIEKTGERIVYSRGLYQYFISDILDDDIVLVEPVETPELIPDNKVVVVRFNDESSCGEKVVCKRLRKQPGGNYLLTSDNPEGKVIPFTGADISWIGVVVKKISEM